MNFAARGVQPSARCRRTLVYRRLSNDFELAIAVTDGVFGASAGPLIEVLVLVSLVYVALWPRRRLAGRLLPCPPPDLRLSRSADGWSRH
jgi:ACR3 family arsenite efflux pump ArsB